MPVSSCVTIKNFHAKEAKPASYFSLIATNANTDAAQPLTISLKNPRDKETDHPRKQTSRLVATHHNINDVDWLQNLNEDITWIQGDPIQEISERLNQNRQAGKAISELHIVAHGSNGEIKLGNTLLTKQYLEESSELLKNWKLEAIYLWSCEAGLNTQLTTTLEECTGADVYSSKTKINREQPNISSKQEKTASLEALIGREQLQRWSSSLIFTTLVKTSSYANQAEVLSDGRHVYIADDGGGLKIVDLQAGSGPAIVGTNYRPFGVDMVYDVIANSTHAFLSYNNSRFLSGSDASQVHVLDISNPTSPTVTDTITLPIPRGARTVSAWNLTLNGNDLYVSDNNAGIHIVDASDPSNLSLTTTFGSTSVNHYDAAISGNYVFAATDSGLIVYDASASYNNVGNASLSGSGHGRNIKLSADAQTAFLSNMNGGLDIFDISNPTAPSLLDSYSTSGNGNEVILSSDESRAYLADGPNGLVILDVSDTSNIQLVNTHATSAKAQGVQLSSDEKTIFAVSDQNAGDQANNGLQLGVFNGVTIAKTGTTDGSGNLLTTEAGSSSAFTVVLDAAPTANVSVSVTGLDTTENSLSTNTLTFTTANWNTPQTITVNGVDDILVDGDISTTLTATASNTGGYAGTETATTTVKNTDDDTNGITIAKTGTTDGSGNLLTTEAGSSSAFTVVLDAAPTANVSVSVTGLDTTENSLSTNTLTFTTANWNTPQTITVNGVDDILVDGDISTTLTATASNTGGYAGTETATTTVKNTDDDTNGITIAKTGTTDGSGNLLTTEAGSSSAFTVVLDAAPTANVSVSVTGLDTTENSLSTNTLTFTTANWNTPQTITVNGVDDILVDGDISTTLTATASNTGGYAGTETATTTVKNTDDDTNGITIAKTGTTDGSGNLLTTEAGSSSAFTVVLDAAPTANVSVSVTGLDTTENSLSTNTLTFTTANWNTPQTITVNGVDDILVDGDISTTLTATASNTGGYAGTETATTTVKNTDDDTNGINDDSDRDGILPSTEEALATLAASKGTGGNIGDMNSDGKRDSEQNAVATLAWRNVADFESGNAGTLKDSEPIICISALSRNGKADDDNLQLENIRVIDFLDTNEFGSNASKSISTNPSTGAKTINLASGESLSTTWDPLGFSLKPKSGISNLLDADSKRQGIQVQIYIDTRASNLNQNEINSFIKFVSQASIDKARNSDLPLEDLDGNVIDREGWYDFTQRRDNTGTLTGDGAELVFDGEGKLQGINLTLTDNHFGDNNPESMQISDPGALAFRAIATPTSTKGDLYLLLDTSTSMLHSEGKEHSKCQCQLALKAFAKDAERAGYQFQRRNTDSTITSTQLLQTLANQTSTQAIQELDQYTLIDNPNDAKNADDLDIHLITYDYHVQHNTFTLSRSNPNSGIDTMQAILSLKMAGEEVHGNSIKNNTKWTKLGLPNPSRFDLHQGSPDRPSNLYAGTELLGALEGLDYLLNNKANDTSRRDQSTKISLFLDGRPERRSWWDTRTNSASDSITGLAIPLPKSLGKEDITTSGLLYDNKGNPHFFKNNQGQWQWKAMQNDLNAALDRLATYSTDPTKIQVNAYGLNSTGSTSLKTTYQDLFSNQSFDNSSSSWSYAHQIINSLGDINF